MKQGYLKRVCAMALTACLMLMATVAFPAPVRAENARKVLVLTYHKVLSKKRKKKHPEARMTLSVGQFARQMRWLREKHYTAITCDELYRWHEGEFTLPKRSVLITFDDGYASTIERIIPVLEKYDLKATVFVIGATTYYGEQSKYISTMRIRELRKSCRASSFRATPGTCTKRSARRAATPDTRPTRRNRWMPTALNTCPIPSASSRGRWCGRTATTASGWGFCSATCSAGLPPGIRAGTPYGAWRRRAP